MTIDQHGSEIYDFTEKLIAAGFILISLILSGLVAMVCAPVKVWRRIVR